MTSLLLTEEQESIRRTARDLVKSRAPIAVFRKLRDERDALGYSRDAWREMASLGLCGLAIAEEDGGTGLGLAELGLVFDECGRTLAPTPLLSTSVLAASALSLSGDASQRAEHLPAIAAGERIIALAHDEGRFHDRYRVSTSLKSTSTGLTLDGEKSFVLDGHVADAFVVTARVSGNPGDRDGLALVLVPAKSKGVTVSRRLTVDHRNVASVRFEGVTLTGAAVLGESGRAADVLDRVLDRGTIALSAEMLGGARESFERTVQYLKDRKQFGVPIGSFQALKHRAAHLFCELELLTSVVLHALRSDDAADRAQIACVAKARATDTFLLAANEGVQMHGGIGVTDDHDIGLFLKRARVCEMTFGGAAYQRDRFAALSGY